MARKPTKPAAAGETEEVQGVTIRAKTPIRWDGDDYAEGAEIVMPAEQAEALIAAGAAIAVEATA